ncbi:MAG: aspartyl protease family protein [Pyrinomonadaceae bacterium]|nr:aspartyl protease family protein [Pyrinomonadaceae bacterium]
MCLKSSFCKLALVMAFGIGFVAATVSAQSAQPERRMADMRLPGVNFPAGKSFVEVPFEVESNLMVIPVSINGSSPLRFVLDTGAQGTFLHNSSAADSLHLKITETVQVRGAGGGGAAIEASMAENVSFNIGGIECSGGRMAVRKRSSGSSSMAGHDGVIGREVFANLVVEVDWEKRVVRFYESAKYKYSGKGMVLPLTFDEGGRPYTMAAVSVTGDKKAAVKLVVDTGGSHTLSLNVGSKPEISLPEGARKTVLGRGVSGEITGHAGRVKSFEFGGQTLRDVPTDFPDESSGTAGIGGRQGNLGGGVLRRFKVIYDYSRQQMIVEPNKFAGELFGTAMPENVAANTAKVSPSALQDYIGKYGNKEISIKDGALYYQRIGGRGAVLRATGKDKFALNTDAQITFVRDDKGIVYDMLIEWVDRDKEILKRELPVGHQPAGQSQSERELSSAEREVRKLEREWLDAYEKHDAEAMNRILSDDFKLTFSNGSVQTKADVLAQLKSARDSSRPSPKFMTEEVQSRVEGDTVILTGRLIQQMERDGQTRTMQMRYTDTYAKRQGRWQVIASQLTRIQTQ